MEEPLSPFGVFVASTLVAGLSGLATLLRSATPLTTKLVVSSLLNSGMLGLGISLIWYARFADNTAFLVGICVLSGLGGMASIDVVLAALRKGGFSIKMGKDSVEMPEKSDDK